MLADIPLEELTRQIRKGGVYLHLGPFSVRIRAQDTRFVESFARLYGRCRADLEEREITDFHVNLVAPTRLRRLLRRQVIADIEGPAPFVPLPAGLSLLMLETAMNWCVASRVREYLVMHAAVVERGGAAVILPGESGSGKSTLCAALVASGFRLLSDEFALCRIGDGALIPYPRPISLKNQSIELIQQLVPEGVFAGPFLDTPKGRIAYLAAPESAIAEEQVLARPKAIVFPRYAPDAAGETDWWPRAAAFGKLTQYSVNYGKLGESGFSTLARIVDASAICEIRYASLTEAIAQVEAAIAGERQTDAS